MIIYRIASADFKEDLSGEGAALYGARWNSVGTKMLYTAGSISLAVLEALVHLKERNFPPNQYLLKISVAGTIDPIEITNEKIKADWKKDLAYSRWIGDEFSKNNESLIMKIPSAVIQEEGNFIINPLHKDFKKIKLVSTEKLELDKRLSMQ